nr:hypothetical protein [Tanacetum cinerariifolium]
MKLHSYTHHILTKSTLWLYQTSFLNAKGSIHKSQSHPSTPTPIVGKMHKEAQQAAGGPTSLWATSKEGAHPYLSSDSMAEVDPGPSAPNDFTPPQQGVSKELGADEISKKIKLEDLADLLKYIRYAFFAPDSLPDELIIVSNESDQEEVKKAKETPATSQDVPEDTSVPHHPSPRLPELSKLLASHDFTSCLPTKLKELLSKIIRLSREIKELKQHIKDMEIELPRDLKEIPSKLETFTSIISNLSSQEKLKTLDSLLGILKMVTFTLNRFATLVENASGAITTGVPSEDKATALLAEGEKDADTNLKNELVDLLGIDIFTQYYNKKLLYERYCEKMKKRRQSSKIINYDVFTKKGSLKVYREDGIAEVIETFKDSDLQLAEWREKVYKAGKGLLYAKINKAISLGKGASKVSREVHSLFLKGLYQFKVNKPYVSFQGTNMKDTIKYKGKNMEGAFMSVPIFVGNFFVVTHFVVVENMGGYLDQDIGDVIFRESFCKASCVEARMFDGLITIHNGNDNVTYQMA